MISTFKRKPSVQEIKATYDKVSEKFSDAMPTELTGLSIKSGEWKFDYDNLSLDGIRANITTDRRSKWCAQNFAGFHSFDVLELGPGEGYCSAGIEAAGANSNTAIEGNSENFIKCVILKNALDLKTKFLYGDAVRYVANTERKFDLIFACGMLYHLTDPIQFILNCAKISPRIYIWTTLFSEAIVKSIDYEERCFAHGENREVNFKNSTFTYHQRFYQPDALNDVKYAGGMSSYSEWLTRDDFLRAVDLAGYRTVQIHDDECGGVPVLNYFGEK